MRRSRFLGSLVAALLAVSAVYCGDSTENTSADAGTSGNKDGGGRDASTSNNNGSDAGSNPDNKDAGQNSNDAGQTSNDAGQDTDAGTQNDDAGTTGDDGGTTTTTDPLIRTCGTPSFPAGTNLTVMVGTKTLDFSQAAFTIEYIDDDDPEWTNLWAEWTITDTDGNEHYLDVDMYGGFVPATCPTDVVLPDSVNDNLYLGLYDLDQTYEAWGDPSGSGTLTIDSFNGNAGSLGVSFSCANCKLVDLVGGPDVTITGSAYGHE